MNGRDPGDWMELAARARRDDPLLSPCIGVCVMDPPSGYCSGCLRSLAEIAAWSGASEDTRRAIKASLAARRVLVAHPGTAANGTA